MAGWGTIGCSSIVLVFVVILKVWGWRWRSRSPSVVNARLLIHEIYESGHQGRFSDVAVRAGWRRHGLVIKIDG